MARQLRKQWPKSVIEGIGTPDAIGQYSKTLDRFFPVETEDELMDCAKRIEAEEGHGTVKAFICSNPMLESIVFHHPELFDWFVFENKLEIYRQIVDKVAVDRLCRSLHVNRPEEYHLTGDLSTIHFPVVVKPLLKESTTGASKCAFFSDKISLENYLAKLKNAGVSSDSLVCQQCVRGDNRWEYGYGGFFSEGEPSVEIFFYQFIQVPQGLCCYTREISDPKVIQQIREAVSPILIKTRFNGFLEFDIKQDEKDGRMYVLDINPRPWRSADMLAGKLGMSTVFAPSVSDARVVWRYPYREVMRRKNKKNVSYKLCKAMAPGCAVTQLALFDRSDNAPFYRQMREEWKDFLRLVTRKIQR